MTATPGQAALPVAALEAAAAAIMTAQNANDDEPEHWEAAHLAKVALEAALPLLAAQEPHAASELATLRAELTELTENHEQLLEEILKNADEDVNGGDEAAESLAEQYVRWLEAEREQLLSDAREHELAKPAPELAVAKPDLRTAWRLADERLALLGEILGHPGIGQVPAALRAKWHKRAGLPS